MKKEQKLMPKLATPLNTIPKKSAIISFPWLWLIGTAAATFLVYIQTVKHEFVNWDDDRYLFDVPQLTAFTWANVKYFFTNYHYLMYLPITMLSYMLDYKLGTLANPGVYHFSNIVYHTINTVLVFIFIYRLKMKYSSANLSRNYAFVVASLFGLITLHVESVAWVSERKDLLYTLFYFSALISYLKYVDTSKSKFYILSLFLFLLSLISKAQAMPLVFMLIGIDLLLKRQAFSKKVIIEKIPFFILGALFGYLAIVGNQTGSTESGVVISFLQRLVYACYAYTTYIVKIFVPYKLSVVYLYPVEYKEGLSLFYLCYILPVFGIVWAFLGSLRKVLSQNSKTPETKNLKANSSFELFNREFLFGLIFFTFNIVIVLQVFSYHNVIMADRYSYVSSVGIFYILAAFIHFIIEKKWITQKLIWLVFAAFLTIQSINTYNRIGVWKDTLSLWYDTTSKYPDVLFAWLNMGNIKAEKGDLKGAISDYDEVLKRDPTDLKALSNRGVTWGKLGNPKAALEDLTKLANLDSLNKEVFSDRGNVRVMLNDYNGALQDYNRALQIQPNNLKALFNRGSLYFKLENWKAASADFTSTIRFSKSYPNAYYYLGLSKANLGEWNEALNAYNTEFKNGNITIDLHYVRALAYYNLKNYSAAISDYNTVAQSITNNGLVFYYRGLSKYFLGQKSEACADLQKAVQLGNQLAKTALVQYCK